MSKIANKYLAQMAGMTLKGNNSGSTANPQDLTVAQVIALLTQPEYDNGNSGAFDFSNSQAQLVTLNADKTFTTTNQLSGAAYVLRIVQDGTGNWVITWPGSVTWLNATNDPPSAGGPSTTLLVNLYCYDGTNFLGSFVAGY